MKKEIQDILDYVEHGQEITNLRELVKRLGKEEPTRLDEAIKRLLSLVQGVNMETQEYLGYYYLFLGCIYYEKGDYGSAIFNLQSAIPQLWESQQNKAVAHWLLSVNYADNNQFTKARGELQEALRLLTSNNRTSSYLAYKKSRHTSSIKEKIEAKLNSLLNKSLFDETPPNPRPKNKYPAQEPPEYDDSTAVHLHLNIKGTSTSNSEDEATKTPYKETRTDEGFLTIESIIYYDQNTGAHMSGEPANIDLNIIGNAEVRSIFFENREYTIHSLKKGLRELKILKNSKWNAVKVTGQSMNKMTGKVSIMHDDLVLYSSQQNAEENDIVVVQYPDPQTGQYMIIVKRYKKDRGVLKSETDQIGDEYQEIDIRKVGAKIIGVVYAVAKPRT